MNRPLKFALAGFLTLGVVLGIYQLLPGSAGQAANQDPEAIPQLPNYPITQNPKPRPTPTPATEFEWTPSTSETFLLAPGALVTYPVTSNHASDPLLAHWVQFDIRSSAGVDAGVMENDFSTNVPNNIANWFGSPLTLCYTPSTIESKHTCRLAGMHTHALLGLRDPRPIGAKAAAGLIAGAILGTKEPVNNFTKENRITLTMYAWQCVRNCPADLPMSSQR